MKEFNRLTLAVLLLGACSLNANAQFGNLLNKVKNSVKYKVENKVDRAIDRATDKVVDAPKNAVKGKKGKKSSSSDEDVAQGDDYQVNATAAKSDFVPGSVVIFEDKLTGEQIGEFPSKWDLVRGNCEVAKVNGELAIAMSGEDCWIEPLMKDGSKDYLGDVFTVEYDYMYDDRKKDGAPRFELDFMHPQERRDNEVFEIRYHMLYDLQNVECNYVRMNDEGFTDKRGSSTKEDVGPLNDGRWHHYAMSFNKRALKFYIDGVRVINIPAAKAGAGWVTFWNGHGNANRPAYLKNVRIAKGAVELYERNTTDVSAVEKAIMETGKFVTNNILFETGKATLKPESMTEIQKVADYMKKNPSARFEVQGHTDNDGSDKINDPLSQQRAEAVVKALASLGVDDFNLKAVGKGSHEPVADNKTAEGKAKNRRVEFIKR